MVVQVLRGDDPVPGAVVWAEPYDDGDDDDPEPTIRRGETDAAGLVRVPIRKGGTGPTTLFARDRAGRIGGGSVDPDELLSAPDLVLSEVAPLTARLVGTDGRPIGGATLTPEYFQAAEPPTDGRDDRIDVPRPARDELAAKTTADGRFTLPAVPIGYGCEVKFRTEGYGEGRLFFPAGFAGECRLAPAGEVRVRVSGDGGGATIRGVWCRLNETEPADRSGRGAVVDGYRSRRHDGADTFVIRNVVPGKYEFEIEGTPQDPVLPTAVVKVTVGPGGTAEATIPVRRAGKVTGRVVATGTAERRGRGEAGSGRDTVEVGPDTPAESPPGRTGSSRRTCPPAFRFECFPRGARLGTPSQRQCGSARRIGRRLPWHREPRRLSRTSGPTATARLRGWC